MSNEETHTQCRLERTSYINEDVTKVYYAWIPTEKAIKGKYLEIKFGDLWENGWMVTQTYTSLPTVLVREREGDYKKTRKASDI